MKKNFLLPLVFIALCFCSSFVIAASLRFSPITINLNEKQRSNTLTILNQSAEATTLQARVFEWTQKNGEDVLTPSSDLAVSPAIITLLPATSYNFRIVRIDQSSVIPEKSYRIILDELPTPIDTRTKQQGLTVLLRSALPVFITNKDAILDLSWQFDHSAKLVMVTIQNNGTRHAKFSKLALVDLTTNTEYQIKVDTTNGYILHGQQQRYLITNQNFSYQSQHQYAIKSVVNRQQLQF